MTVLFVLVAAFALLAFRPYQTATPPVVGSAPVAVATATPEAVTPVPVAPAAPAADPGPSDAVFIAELIAITAFFQKRFGLSGYALMGLAAGVGVVLWFAPLISLTVPAAAAWIDSGVAFVKLFLTAMGSVDFVTTVGSKIATAQMDAAGKITTGTPVPTPAKTTT